MQKINSVLVITGGFLAHLSVFYQVWQTDRKSMFVVVFAWIISLFTGYLGGRWVIISDRSKSKTFWTAIVWVLLVIAVLAVYKTTNWLLLIHFFFLITGSILIFSGVLKLRNSTA